MRGDVLRQKGGEGEGPFVFFLIDASKLRNIEEQIVARQIGGAERRSARGAARRSGCTAPGTIGQSAPAT
jgi:hypothetical protein